MMDYSGLEGVEGVRELVCLRPYGVLKFKNS